MSSRFSPLRMRRNPAACSNVLGPMPGTFRNCARERKLPFSFRKVTMLRAVRSVTPAT